MGKKVCGAGRIGKLLPSKKRTTDDATDCPLPTYRIGRPAYLPTPPTSNPSSLRYYYYYYYYRYIN